MIVNQRQLAEIFGAGIETVIQWQKRGMPVVERKKGPHGNKYDTAAVFRWRLAEEKGETVDLADARQRLATAQAERYEIENAVSRGDLLRAQDVLDAWTRQIVECRALLLAGPTKLAPICVAVRELDAMRLILEDWLEDALRRLIVGRVTVPREGGAIVGTPAAPQRKRVGRPRKTPEPGSVG